MSFHGVYASPLAAAIFNQAQVHMGLTGHAGLRARLYAVRLNCVDRLMLGACKLQVEEDRRPQVEAAIVRVLKARRLLDHNSIVAQARLTPQRP